MIYIHGSLAERLELNWLRFTIKRCQLRADGYVHSSVGNKFEIALVLSTACSAHHVEGQGTTTTAVRRALSRVLAENRKYCMYCIVHSL